MNAISPLLQTIVYWQHSFQGQSEGEAHCLARVYRLPSQQGVVVFSALRDDERVGLILDLPGAANALLPTIASLNLDRSAVRWVSHHGSFSHYEALEQEEFCQVDLRWNGAAWEGSLTDIHVLSPAAVIELQKSIDLTSVFAVLLSIGFFYGSM